MSQYGDVICHSAVLHDILLEIVDTPTDEMVDLLYEKLPRIIRWEAITWGWSDTCVKEDIFTFLKSIESEFK